MDVMTAIETRREITQFDDRPIPRDVRDRLVRALCLSPSGNNLPSREFVLVSDRSMLRTLARTTPYMPWLEQAALGVVIIGDPTVSKYWLQDATIAGAYLWLAAVSFGLGAAWGAVFHSEDAEETARRERYVRNALGIPPAKRPVAIIGVGYPAARPAPKEPIPPEKVVHYETYGRGGGGTAG
ncbi:MAG: nitroreductase [Candidatus Reconcilbacillus cellulovorans]|uniref:Nitroreductase n=1 Tax=Candidatus Reconcilbacillus cellulovorans TaxID=1906605 RepID=A0A2A6E1J1_9BACL|nr:MAG: nitroreductase [Candidatus Reconcilbacillus cellulovorans]